jgi:hypothetical protein
VVPAVKSASAGSAGVKGPRRCSRQRRRWPLPARCLLQLRGPAAAASSPPALRPQRALWPRPLRATPTTPCPLPPPHLQARTSSARRWTSRGPSPATGRPASPAGSSAGTGGSRCPSGRWAWSASAPRCCRWVLLPLLLLLLLLLRQVGAAQGLPGPLVPGVPGSGNPAPCGTRSLPVHLGRWCPSQALYGSQACLALSAPSTQHPAPPAPRLSAPSAPAPSLRPSSQPPPCPTPASGLVRGAHHGGL